MPRRARILLVGLLAPLVAAPAAAAAMAPGAGVRGTVTLRWSGISGSPITAWSGQAVLAFDPSVAARRSTLAAIASPSLGEAYRPVFAPQLQAARVTSLTASRTETVVCPDTAPDGSPTTFEATYSSAAGGIADGRVAFELLPPRVDLITGRGSVSLAPYEQAHPDGYFIRDRIVLPGRYAVSGAYPCPGEGAPSDRLPRILAPNGGGAVPVVMVDWLRNGARGLRRTPQGWKVLLARARRDTFSESRFGPQDTQALDVRVTSDVYLAGSLVALAATCQVPFTRIERARTAAAAVRWARRAGLDGAVYVGTRVARVPERRRFAISGRLIDSQGGAPCHRGRYTIVRYVKAR